MNDFNHIGQPLADILSELPDLVLSRIEGIVEGIELSRILTAAEKQ